MKALSQLQILAKEIEETSVLPLEVPKRLGIDHALVSSAKKGLAMGDNAAWWNYGLIGSGSGNLDIRVSKDLISRSLRIMDTIVKMLEARGHEIVITGYTTKVKVSEIELEISLREKRNRIKIKDSKWDSYEHVPSGLLIFQVGYSYKAKIFIDGRFPLEKQIAKIIAYVEIREVEEMEEQIRLEKSWEEQRKKREVEEKHRQILLDESESTKKLLSDAQQWRIAEDMRSYVAAAANSKKYSNKWIRWAKDKADWIDPLIKEKDKILGDFNESCLA